MFQIGLTARECSSLNLSDYNDNTGKLKINRSNDTYISDIPEKSLILFPKYLEERDNILKEEKSQTNAHHMRRNWRVQLHFAPPSGHRSVYQWPHGV